MLVFACQLDIVWEDPAANFAKVRSLLSRTTIPAGSLIALPEMFATGFSMNVAGIAEADAGPTQRFLAEMAKQYQSLVIGGGVGREADGRGANYALLAEPEGRVSRYQKLHPFTFGGEGRHYAPGRQVVVQPWQGVSVSPLICYDLRFPESFRAAVRLGAQLFVVIADWPAVRHPHWQPLLVARAIENQAFVLGVNRCGRDPLHEYAGQSMLVNPRGQIVAIADSREQALAAELDLSVLTRYRGEFPALSDMRADGV